MFEEIHVEDATDFVPYHDATPKRSSQVPPELRPFIAWDGEGQNLRGEGKPQSYVLFGCSTGDRIRSNTHIHTFDLLDLIIRVGKENPTAFHVGFAFNYDANMILQSLSEPALAIIHRTGKLTLRREGVRYHINFLPGKWFSVSKYGPKYDRKKNPHDKVTVKIYDLFTFFAKSFLKAYQELIGDPPEEVVQGKADRNDFGNMSLDYVEKYWRIEIEMLRVLAEELRRRVYGAGYRITQWHGPGALASHALRIHRVKEAKAYCPTPVREAAAFAYAGGRFEMFRLGRTMGPIYSVDINSAYPHAITRLPSLSIGQWRHVVTPKSVARFGVYRVRLLPTVDGTFLEKAPGPLFHRDARGNISFPWVLEGWYWSPEVMNLFKLSPDRYEIVEGWEYLGASRLEAPFEWMKETYRKRKEWKAAGNGAQLALKLLMNSIYGKLAQRVGWNEVKRLAPTWHQLEWAGWITSHCRAMLWDLMSSIPRESIIAVETDGLYTTTDPATIGITDSSELGGWEVTEYDEILYVQSGMAWLRKGSCKQQRCIHQNDKGESVEGCAWTCKRRGLDAKTFSLAACQSYLASLGPEEQWESYIGKTTRFTGLGAALNSSTPTKSIHCRWETTTRDISPGQGGKRVHVHSQCPACMAGQTAYQAAHELSIRSLAYKDPMSFPHHIPWEGDGKEEPYEWEAHSAGDFGDSSIAVV
jgi:hypothetical protein